MYRRSLTFITLARVVVLGTGVRGRRAALVTRPRKVRAYVVMRKPTQPLVLEPAEQGCLRWMRKNKNNRLVFNEIVQCFSVKHTKIIYRIGR